MDERAQIRSLGASFPVKLPARVTRGTGAMTRGADDETTAARPVRSTGGPASPSVVREVAKVVVVSLIAVGVFVAASVPFLRHLGRTEAIRDARSIASLAAAGIVEPNLENGFLSGKAESIARIDRVVQERVLSESIVRVKIWTAEGRIVYSDEPRLIGTTYTLPEDELAVLASGGVKAELSDLSGPENRFERAEGELLEVYLRIRAPDGTPLLFEAYEPFDSVLASGRRIWLSFLPAVLAALVLLWIVQTPLTYRLASRLRRRHEEREVLLQRALDASDAERRRIAGDLHDGVVQDLAGVSFSLEAAAEGVSTTQDDTELQAALREGAAATRTSMRRLRSLLLEIHPPNLQASGLTAALTDLAAPLERRGIEVELDVEEPAALGVDATNLLFRVARESLRNIVEHASATRVRVCVEAHSGGTRLTVEDDGVGFDEALLQRRRDEGHVGLSLLQEHAAHQHAQLDVESVPHHGTTVVLEVPA